MIECALCKERSKLHIKLDKTWSIYHCTKCKICFTHPFPVLPDYVNEDFHSKDKLVDDLTFVEDLDYDWRKLIHLQKKLLKENLDQGNDILEIGCGEGILLYELLNDGFVVTGIEASSSAKNRGIRKGLNIKQGYFDQLKTESTYDCVIMSHVLEHISDLDATILAIRKVLKPGGVILLTQTNYLGLIPIIQRERWYAWVPDQHYWHFTEKSLVQLLSQYDFNKVDCIYSSLIHPHDFKYKLARIIPSMQDQYSIIFKQKI